MIAVLLPEAWRILGQEFETGHPFGALPEVKMGNQETNRSAVLGRERRAIVMGGQQVLLPVEIGEREIGGVVRRGMHEDKPRGGVRLGELEDGADRDAGEAIVVSAPRVTQ